MGRQTTIINVLQALVNTCCSGKIVGLVIFPAHPIISSLHFNVQQKSRLSFPLFFSLLIGFPLTHREQNKLEFSHTMFHWGKGRKKDLD